MRISTLIVLVVLLLGLGYVWMFKRDWLSSRVQEGRQLATGFTPATTPAEALDKFREAIQGREYDYAAT